MVCFSSSSFLQSQGGAVGQICTQSLKHPLMAPGWGKAPGPALDGCAGHALYTWKGVIHTAGSARVVWWATRRTISGRPVEHHWLGSMLASGKRTERTGERKRRW